ncbi:MAG: type II CRISPR RNA-guided endonuclease Cas9, partial [Clostridia bacterium]|nr:type II CRISPR RNA-guided endonuclease Cas9 [Clostridia bacterium]
MENKKYYLGLDIGTDSVGYAATYEDYSLCKYRGEPMWGTHLFDPAEQSAQRRAFRTARRRLDRRQQRVLLLQEIFAAEIHKIDPRFFIRIRESALFPEDKSDISDRYSFFHDPDYTDIDYHKAFPTIHHLIHELMTSDQPHDPRLVYLACAWLVAHRGHFLSELNMENIRELDSFDSTYREFTEYYAERDILLPWECDVQEFSRVLQLQKGITEKNKEFLRRINGGKAFKDTEDGPHRFDRTSILKLLSGGTVAPKSLFFNADYADIESITLGKDEEKLELILS